MASINDRRWAVRDGEKVPTGYKGDKPWRARWREYPGGPQQTEHFAKKCDAETHLTEVQHQLLTGSYVNPKAGKLTVKQYSSEWLARRHWRPATQDRVERELRLHILPGLGDRQLATVRREHVEKWAADLPLAPSSVGTTHSTLVALFAAAIDDGRLVRNPAAGAHLPAESDKRVVPMEVAEVKAFTAAMAEHVRAAAVLVAATGLRQGEAFGITTDRIDFLRRELRVDRQLWTPRSGSPVFAPVKSANSNRTVALSSLALEAVAAHVEAFGAGRDGLVFHIDRRPVSRAMVATYARRATKARRAAFAAGLNELEPALSARERAAAASRSVTHHTWHDLRHHHASVLLSAGVSPPLVAERLGHSVQTLLRTYAHVIRSDDDRVRSIIDTTLGKSAEDWLRTEGVA